MNNEIALMKHTDNAFTLSLNNYGAEGTSMSILLHQDRDQLLALSDRIAEALS